MYLLRNIKLSVKIETIPLNIVTDILALKDIPYKIYPNFISFTKIYSFTIFKPNITEHNNHLNITKLKIFEHIHEAIEIIEDLLNRGYIKYKVDNIIATTDLHRKLNLAEILSKSHKFNIKYNNERFPGLFMKFHCGTAIVFHTGKIVIVGCKEEKHVEWIHSYLTANI